MNRALPALALALLLASPAVARHKPAPEKQAPAKTSKTAAKKAPKKTTSPKAGPKKAAPTKAASPPSSLETASEYTVRPGDTLETIALRARIPRVLIAEASHLPKPWKLRTGQKLRLPRTRHHIVAPGETGFDIAYRYGVPFASIAVANGLTGKAVIRPGQDLLIPTILPPPEDATGPTATAAPKPDDGDDARPQSRPTDKKAAPQKSTLIWPLEGKVRRGFTPRSRGNSHDGIDIVAPPGTAVRATDAGTVIFAGKEPKSFGNLVVIDHGNGWQSAYGFLGKITVTKGEPIRRRERLGLVGRTGKAKQDELHFELRKANEPVDPLGQLPAR